MRRNIGRHADGDPRGAVDQQIGNAGRQNRRLFERIVIVRDEIDGFLFDIGEHFLGQRRHANFRVTHRRRIITVDGAKIALAVDQRVAQVKILRHAHDRIVDRRVAVGMILTHDIADQTGGFLVRFVGSIARVVHRVEHAPMHRL